MIKGYKIQNSITLSYENFIAMFFLPLLSDPSFPGRCTLLHTRILEINSLKSAAVRTYSLVILSNSSTVDGQFTLCGI